MHRRLDLWGPDGQFRILNKQAFLFLKKNDCVLYIYIALEFDPDRFLDERLQKYLIPNPFIFLPFNAGPRICLGQQVRSSSNPSIHPSLPILYSIYIYSS